MGHFSNEVKGNKSRVGAAKVVDKNAEAGCPPSFVTVNLLYIDLLKRITRLDSILNEKYCDIDPSFGLHDYTI